MYFANRHKFLAKVNRHELKYLLATTRRMLPEYVFDNASLEGNPMSFPEVKTLLDGITGARTS